MKLNFQMLEFSQNRNYSLQSTFEKDFFIFIWKFSSLVIQALDEWSSSATKGWQYISILN